MSLKESQFNQVLIYCLNKEITGSHQSWETQNLFFIE